MSATHPDMESKIRSQYIRTSLFLYIGCLLLPSVAFLDRTLLGLQLLLLNIIAIPEIVKDVLQQDFYLLTNYPFALANPCYLTSLWLSYYRRSYHLAYIFSLLAMFFILSFLYDPLVPYGKDLRGLSATPHIGYLAWILSAGCLAYANFHLDRQTRQR